MSNFITKLVLDKVKSGIENHAEKQGLEKYDLYLKIYPEDENFVPAFQLCNHVAPISEISFGEFTGIDKFFGFDVAGEGEEWIRKFLIMCAGDNEIDVYDNHFYFIRITKNDQLQAYMYIDNKPFKEISLDYILKTE
jgi:hypothetical protein